MEDHRTIMLDFPDPNLSRDSGQGIVCDLTAILCIIRHIIEENNSQYRHNWRTDNWEQWRRSPPRTLIAATPSQAVLVVVFIAKAQGGRRGISGCHWGGTIHGYQDRYEGKEEPCVTCSD